MNLYNLIKTVKARSQIQTGFPEIQFKHDDETFRLPIFELNRNGWDTLMWLSSLWDKIIPNDGQELWEKHLEIAESVVGKRQRDDFVLLMKWMSKRIDVNNGDFNILLESRMA